jgi:cysteinyl-tRNA synthetase
MPYLHTLSGFRDQVRRMARDNAPQNQFLEACDVLRDTQLVDLGVSLDDQEGECPPQRNRRLPKLTFFFFFFVRW